MIGRIISGFAVLAYAKPWFPEAGDGWLPVQVSEQAQTVAFRAPALIAP
jgi:hypothetical protein